MYARRQKIAPARQEKRDSRLDSSSSCGGCLSCGWGDEVLHALLPHTAHEAVTDQTAAEEGWEGDDGVDSTTDTDGGGGGWFSEIFSDGDTYTDGDNDDGGDDGCSSCGGD